MRRKWALLLKRKITGSDDPDQAQIVMRMALLIGALLLGFGAVIAQASIYQIEEDEVLAERGLNRIQDDYSITGRRGAILDRTGRRILAVSVPVPSVAFYGAPYFVDRVELSFILSEVLNLDPNQVLKKIIAEDKFALIKRHVSEVEAASITKLDLPGVRLMEEERRQYPMGRLLGAVLGYVGKDGQGLAGLESFYNTRIQGMKGVFAVLRDESRNGYFGSGLVDPVSLDGAELVLNIDSIIQDALESELAAVVASERAIGGMAIAMDPVTFEVLAMASIPSLDPNVFETECGGASATDDGTNPCRNKAISYVFEPGSVGKVLTLIAGFGSQKVRPRDTVDGHMGNCMVGKFSVKDVHAMGLGTVEEATWFSSNCAFKELAQRIGYEDMWKFLDAVGVGSPTGIDLPGEAPGTLRPMKRWSSTDLQVAGYGYGYNLTLMHLVVGMAIASNGGIKGTPRVARELRYPDGRVIKLDAPNPVRVLPVEAADSLRSVLTGVVMNPRGTGTKARPKGYTAGGKTGTARINVAHHGYSTERYICSFVGFAPAESPRVVIGVTVIDPKVGKYGGTVAAPVFARAAERILPVLGVQPDPSIMTVRQ